MDVDLYTKRPLIGDFHDSCNFSCNIAQSMINLLQSLDIVIVCFIGLIIEELLVIAGIELNPGPVQEISIKNTKNTCKECNQTLNGNVYDELSRTLLNNECLCKFYLLENKIDSLRSLINENIIGPCVKINAIDNLY